MKLSYTNIYTTIHIIVLLIFTNCNTLLQINTAKTEAELLIEDAIINSNPSLICKLLRSKEIENVNELFLSNAIKTFVLNGNKNNLEVYNNLVKLANLKVEQKKHK